MANWADFAAAAPELAASGRDLVRAATPAALHRDDSFTGYAFIATTRRDGGPRVHPLCPLMAGGRLFIAVAPTSAKLADLRRDGRYMLHAFLGAGDREFALRGTATESADPAVRQLLLRAAEGWTNLHDDEVIFELDIDRVDATSWENVSQPDAKPVRQRWLAGS